MVYELTYSRGDKVYPVVVTVKRIKNIIFRYRDAKFFVSVPRYIAQKVIYSYLDRYSDRLLARDAKATSPYVDDQLYLLGAKVNLFAGEGIKNVFVFGDSLYYKDEKDYDRKMRKFAQEYFTGRVRYYEEVMKIRQPYDVKVRNMKTRFGTNSRKMYALTFQVRLIHFRPDIIDAIVIHELAHDHNFNHGHGFYEELLKYCPNYKILVKKLKRGEFA